MSTETNFHVGSYLEVKVRGKEVEIVESRHCSADSSHDDFITNFSRASRPINFCPKCGATIFDNKKTVTTYPGYHTLIDDHEELEDVLIDTEGPAPRKDQSILILIGNNVSDLDRLEIDLDDSEEKPKEISPEMINSFLYLFKEDYRNIIKFLSCHIDVEYVNCKFGAFVWYN